MIPPPALGPAGARMVSCHVTQERRQPGAPRHLRRRSTRPSEPGVEHVPRQLMLSAGLQRFHRS
jgi:hypothetical protein